MNWNEMIEKRKAKELEAERSTDPKFACDVYELRIERALRQLSPLEERAIRLRFVCPRPIARVADGMGMSWDGADDLIDRAVVKMKQSFLKSMEGAA